MSVSAVNPVWRTDPLLGYSFAIEVDGEIRGWFTECGPLSVEREVKSYAEGGVNDHEHQLPGRVNHANITLKRGLVDDKLWKWFRKGLYDGKVKRRDLSIIVFSGDLEDEAARWDFNDAYPVKWRGPSLKTEDGDALVEEIELAYRGSSGGGQELDLLQLKADESAVSPQPKVAQTIDMPALAAKVYALFQADLRVERERLGYK